MKSLSTTRLILFFLLPAVAAATDLQISKSVSPNPVMQGEEVVFTIIVDNTSTTGGGPLNAPNTTVTDLFPEGPSVLNVSVDGTLLPSNEWDSDWVGNQEKITVNLGTVNAGETVTVTIRAWNGAANGQALTNTASVSSDLWDPDPSNNSTEVVFQVGSTNADLSVTKSASVDSIAAGEPVTYTIVVSNAGPGISTNTLFTDTLPHGLTFQSATASNGAPINHNAAEGVLSSDLGTIAEGETVTITVVTEADLPGQWENEARALGDVSDPDLSNNSGSHTLTIGDPQPPSIGSGVNDGSPGSQADPVLTSTGEYYFTTQPDLEIRGPMTLAFARTYNSSLERNRVKSTLGVNWRHSYDWQLGVFGSDIFITNPQGRVLWFVPGGDSSSWVLQSNQHQPFQLLSTGTGEATAFYLMDPISGLRYQFAKPDGLDAYRCVRILDPQGLEVSLTYDDGGRLEQVSDGLGRTFFLGYNVDGRLSTLTDGSRQVSYAYANDLLAVFTDAGDFETTYTYTESGGFQGLMLSETRPEGNQPVSQTWDPEGRVATQTMGTGNPYTFSYGVGQTTVEDPDGNSMVHFHNGDGNLSKATNASGRDTTISVDETGRREGIMLPSGATREEAFHPESGLLESETHAEGGTISYSYTALQLSPGFALSKVSRIQFPDGTRREFSYTGTGNLSSLSDRGGSTTTFAYNSLGRVTMITNPLGGQTNMTYDASGNLTSLTDSAGNTTLYSYDELSRLITVDIPGPAIRHYNYDYANRITSVSDASGPVVTYSYDGNGNMIQKTGADGTTQYLYDATDRMTGIRPPSGEDIDFMHDSLSRPVAIELGESYSVDFTYDPSGEVVSMNSPGRGLLTKSVDADGRPDTVTDAAGRTAEYMLDGNGLPIAVTYPGDLTYSVAYDALGRVVMRTYPDGQSDHYTYTGEDLLASITVEPSGLTANFTYDAQGNLLAQENSNGTRWNFAYDPSSRITEATDPLGNSIRFAYNDNNRWERVVFPDDMGTLDFDFDANGRTTRRQYSDGTDIQSTYDAAGRRTSSENLSLAYDSEDRVILSNGIQTTWEPYTHQVHSITVAPGKTINYEYDAEGRLISVSDWAGGSVLCDYDSTGRRISLTRGNTSTTSYTYNAMGRVLNINHGFGEMEVSRDSMGTILSVETTVQTPAVPVPPEEDFEYNSLNQISAYSYDALGRRIADDQRDYTYDLADRLTEVSKDDHSTTYSYDGSGLVVGMESEGTEKQIVWNYAFEIPVPQVIRVDGSDAWYMVTGAGPELLYRINAQTDEVQYYHYDSLGHTVALTGNQGQILAAYAYTPQGMVVSSNPGLDNPFTFVGKYGVIHDPDLDLFIMRHRMYDPLSFQFLTRDPFYLLPYPQSMGQYQYAAGDPINNIDPTGLAPVNGDVASTHASSGGPNGSLDTASTASSTASFSTAVSGQAGRLLDAGADLAHVKANQALGASLALSHEVGKTIEANLGGNAATRHFENVAEGYARQAQRLDNLSDGLRTGARPLNALGKASKVLGPLSLGIEAYRGYDRIARSLSRTDETLRLTYEAYETRQKEILRIWREKKKSMDWLREQMDKNLAGYLEEAKGIGDAGLYDGLINIWVTAGDMIGTLIPGYGILFGTEDIANFTHEHVWQNIYH